MRYKNTFRCDDTRDSQFLLYDQLMLCSNNVPVFSDTRQYFSLFLVSFSYVVRDVTLNFTIPTMRVYQMWFSNPKLLPTGGVKAKRREQKQYS